MANYEKAAAKTPEDPTVLNNLAFLIADTGGDTNKALQMVTTALRKAPEVPQLRDTLAWIQIKRHNIPEALSILRALTDKYPDDNMFRYHYSVALIEGGDRESARQQAQTALANKPTPEIASALQNVLKHAQ
jgi:Flp pilus assembly protein TadD